MLVSIAAAFTMLTFLALSLVHGYWAMGGRRGGDAAVPELNGRPVFKPGLGATLTVALLLFGAATLVGLSAGLLTWPTLPHWVSMIGTALVGAVMFLRFVGDFRYVGVFKRIRGTRFARLDTRVYSPLCLALSAGCAIVALAPLHGHLRPRAPPVLPTSDARATLGARETDLH